MTTEYISIGMQCTTAVVMDALGKRTNAYPFDWALTYPLFIEQFLKQIYDEHDIDYLTDMLLDTKNTDTDCIFNGCEYYITVPNTVPSKIYNRKYKITYPHDEYTDENIDKFKRRIERLKTMLMSPDIELVFMYISPPNKTFQYAIDGEILTKNISLHLNNISEFLSVKRNNFKIIYIDCLSDSKLLHKNIIKLNLPEYQSRIDIENICKTDLILTDDIPRFK